jgi:transposase
MANKSISMQKLRQVIRLHVQGKGSKTISSMLGVSRNTIKKYLHIFHSSRIDYEEFCSKSDSELSLLFMVRESQTEKSERLITLERLLPDICKQLKRKGVTREQLHKEYLIQHPCGYARSRFNNYINLYLGQANPVMRIEHKAGEKMYIDFTGRKLHLKRESGDLVSVEVFVATLGCSQLTYVEAVMSQKKEDLIRACENALHYFEGVPQAIVPDNLKSAVSKGSKYEATINPDFASFAEHYSTVVVPARAYKPRDKSLVEGAIKLIYRSIYCKLEGRTFYELESLNAAIRVALEIHNTTPFSGRNYSRRSQFEEIERAALGKLNPLRYEVKEQLLVTVSKNSHVRLSKDIHNYSVPYKYIGKKVKILYTSQTVEIYYRYELIASHARSIRKFQYTTNPEHLASRHRFITEWTPENFIRQAEAIDEDVAHYIGKVLELKPFPEQAYKSCSGILGFVRRVGAERLINACRIANSFGQYGYPTIADILNRHLDSLQVEGELPSIPVHSNIRGKEYFQ